MCAPVAFTTIGWRYYIIFIVLPLIGAVIMHLSYPETKGLTLEGIGKFGDYAAVDLSAMNEEERKQFDKSLDIGQLEKATA